MRGASPRCTQHGPLHAGPDPSESGGEWASPGGESPEGVRPVGGAQSRGGWWGGGADRPPGRPPPSVGGWVARSFHGVASWGPRGQGVWVCGGGCGGRAVQLPTPPRPQFLLRAPRKARLSPAPPPPGFTSPPPSGVGCGGAGLDLNSAPPPGTPMGGGRGASGGSSNGAPGAALREPPPPPDCRLHACAGLRGWGRAVPLRPRAEPSSRYPREGRGLAPAGGGGASTGGAPEWNAVGTQRGSGPQEGGVGRKRPPRRERTNPSHFCVGEGLAGRVPRRRGRVLWERGAGARMGGSRVLRSFAPAGGGRRCNQVSGVKAPGAWGRGGGVGEV